MKSGVAKRGPLQTPRTLLPDVETLSACLTAAFDGHDSCGEEVRILDRKLPRMMSTSPNEVVTCQWANDSKSRVFIKYGAGQSHYSFGHRGGVAYEAEVYRRLLQSLPDFRPKCLGAPADPNSGKTWLILQYVSNAVRVSDLVYKRATRQQRAMAESARWIGKFHAIHEARVHEPEFSFLKRYDAEYYRGWWRRTFEFANPLRRRFTWLNKLREAGGDRSKRRANKPRRPWRPDGAQALSAAAWLVSSDAANGGARPASSRAPATAARIARIASGSSTVPIKRKRPPQREHASTASSTGAGCTPSPARNSATATSSAQHSPHAHAINSSDCRSRSVRCSVRRSSGSRTASR